MFVQRRNCRRLCCRGLLAWTRQQQHDAGAEGSPGSCGAGVASTSQGIAESAVWMACVYRASLDTEDVHAHLFLPINVSSYKTHPADNPPTYHDPANTEPSDNVMHMKIRIRIGAVLLATTFVATFFAILFGCYPVEKHWQINPDPGSMSPRPNASHGRY